MTITFKFEKLESTASPLYRTQAFDELNNVVMDWVISTDDESQLEAIAKESYDLALNPPTPEQLQADVAALKGATA